jgi:GNAT superfamily N-acetyltransferase
LSIAPAEDERLLEGLGELDSREIQQRIRRGHQPWLARVAGQVVGWGWCATEEASIGELGISFQIPPGNRYLWDFVTTPSWRGRGIYPRLLQTIVVREREAERFWLGHDLSNEASARGIAKSGFHEVGVLYSRWDGAFALARSGPVSVAAAASALFGLPVADPVSAAIA